MSKAIPHFDNVAPEMSDSMEFAAAMLTLRAKARAYWHFAVKHKLIWTYAIPTGATDGVYIYVNPDFFFGLPSHGQRAFLLGHEVAHIVLKHGWRGRAFRKIGYFRVLNGVNIPFIHRLWNWVTDAIINADLIAHGLEPIEGAILDDRFDRDFVADDAYLEKFKEWEQEQEDEPADDESEASGNGEPSEAMGNPMPADGDDGDGDDGDADDGDVDGDAVDGEADGDADGDVDGEPDADGGGAAGSDHDGHDTHLEPKYDGSAEEQEDAAQEDQAGTDRTLNDAVKDQQEAVERGEHQNIGTSANVGESVKAGLNRHTAQVSWNEELAHVFTRAGSGSGLTFTQMNRRRYSVMGVVTPATVGTLSHVTLIGDISGSVDREPFRATLNEFGALIDDMEPRDGATILFTNHDCLAENAHDVCSGGEIADLEIPMGGGTYLSSALEYMDEQGIESDVILAFTDAELRDDDLEQLVAAGVIIVLDHSPNRWERKWLEEASAEYIVAVDEKVAA
tara:strand:+ start:570 stop:2093 length:1524 start_codon:yes stop_codon:yes gene_type:complete